jgi:hypothetical protein
MPVESLIVTILVGVVGGYIGGVVGLIGAVVVPGLILLGVDPVAAISSSLLLHVLIAPIGGISHYKLGHVHRGIFVPLTLAGALGAFLGANISTHIPAEELKLLVGVLTIGAGSLVIIKYPRKNETKSTLPTGKGLVAISAPAVVSIALFAGLTHGALGLGWGALGIPFLVLAGVLPHTAVGSSLLSRAFVALAGASTYYFLGFLRADVVLPLLVGGLIAIPFGALTAKRLPPRTLKRIVGISVIVLGISVLIKLVIG